MWLKSVYLYIRRLHGAYSPLEKKIDGIRNKYRSVMYFVYRENHYHEVLKADIDQTRKVIRSELKEMVQKHLDILYKIQKERIKKSKVNTNDAISITRIIYSQKQIPQYAKAKLAGNILSQSIVSHMWRIARNQKISFKRENDDIKNLALQIQKHAKSADIKGFFRKNFEDFNFADRVRNRSCHAWEQPPTKVGIDVTTELLKKLELL